MTILKIQSLDEAMQSRPDLFQRKPGWYTTDAFIPVSQIAQVRQVTQFDANQAPIASKIIITDLQGREYETPGSLDDLLAGMTAANHTPVRIIIK